VSAQALALGGRNLDRLGLRFRVARRRGRLDAALAEGVDPDRDPALVLRARQLTALSTRRAMANTIANLLDAAEEPPEVFGPHGSRPPLRREDVLTCRVELLGLAERLREPRYVPPQAAGARLAPALGLGEPHVRGRAGGER
jgi:hypothetical protein